ncbi:hypothetical protein Ahy_Scaffold6g108044 [Arachis hypogaea]|uniref:Reverse transcriptase zinc-binding domain-containing protein n=1 Tax=Arachis hypogaea TaxID=3818 RepID=A0A444WP70_ARAHY|nr:hypothetical protein Ahy_Scaffold6g108044 [Arachis hypogaea]
MPGVHHLIDFAQPEVFPNMLEERVCDYVSDRRWDLNRIAVVLGDDWIPVFRSTKTPEPEMGEDILAWLLTSDGAFSIKSACSLYLSPSDNSKAKLFSKIWKLEAPQRLHTFCWLVANEVLLTNEIRVKRNMTHDGSCVSCGEAIESMFHVIRDCRVARQTWMSIDTRLRFGNFFNTPLLPWLLENLSSQSLFKGVHWPLLFVCTMNALWLRRNKVIFDSDEAVAENSIHFLAFRLAKDYSMAQLELAQSRKKKEIDLHDTRSLVLAIRNRCSRLTSWNIHHQFREANTCADRLAHFGHSLPSGCHIFFTLPSCISLAFHADSIGIALPRVVSI